jgi:hypothetical protein
VLKFFVVPNDTQPILSADACTELCAIVRVHDVDKPLTKYELIKDYGDVFKGLGKLPKAHHIQLDPFVEPVVHPPRKVPAALREQVRAELDRMVNLGVIAKQDEPTDWVSSMVVVRKRGKLRICLDPKDLNRAIKREQLMKLSRDYRKRVYFHDLTRLTDSGTSNLIMTVRSC